MPIPMTISHYIAFQSALSNGCIYVPWKLRKLNT
jgi:hypothetical protein